MEVRLDEAEHLLKQDKNMCVWAQVDLVFGGKEVGL